MALEWYDWAIIFFVVSFIGWETRGLDKRIQHWVNTRFGFEKDESKD